MKRDGKLRDRIVDVALDIIETHGLKALTQPRLAKETGLRQSHLTYYFPRKVDLFAALLEGSHKRAVRDHTGDILDLLQSLICGRERMRFFLGLVLELSEEPDLRDLLAEHARELAVAVASYFERRPDDPALTAFIDRARGIGIRLLAGSSPHPDSQVVDLHKLAHEMGLKRPDKNIAHK